jgi:hypothetical protein
MDVLIALFWGLTFWLVAMLAIRIYWYKKEKYGYLSWFFEWLLFAVSCLGVYSVAYQKPIFNPLFWWFTLLMVIGSSVYRIKSKRFAEQVSQLNKPQKLIVKLLMFLITLPVCIGLIANASNSTGLWSL